MCKSIEYIVGEILKGTTELFRIRRLTMVLEHMSIHIGCITFKGGSIIPSFTGVTSTGIPAPLTATTAALSSNSETGASAVAASIWIGRWWWWNCGVGRNNGL